MDCDEFHWTETEDNFPVRGGVGLLPESLSLSDPGKGKGKCLGRGNFRPPEAEAQHQLLERPLLGALGTPALSLDFSLPWSHHLNSSDLELSVCIFKHPPFHRPSNGEGTGCSAYRAPVSCFSHLPLTMNLDTSLNICSPQSLHLALLHRVAMRIK